MYKKEFSVVCNYIDPPDPGVTHRFISETAARLLFGRLIAIEREVNPGGEWEIVLYRNPDGKSLIALDRFSYMDLLQETHD